MILTRDQVNLTYTIEHPNAIDLVEHHLHYLGFLSDQLNLIEVRLQLWAWNYAAVHRIKGIKTNNSWIVKTLNSWFQLKSHYCLFMGFGKRNQINNSVLVNSIPSNKCEWKSWTKIKNNKPHFKDPQVAASGGRYSNTGTQLEVKQSVKKIEKCFNTAISWPNETANQTEPPQKPKPLSQ